MSIGSVADIVREPLLKRIAELEGDLQIAQTQLQRIDEELVGAYGEIATMRTGDLRRRLQNIAYIVNPTRG
jgi:hypothetical protein